MMKNKTVNYVVVRTETRVKNFTYESNAKAWVEQQKQKDGSRNLKGKVEYSIWESPMPAVGEEVE